MSSKMHDLAVIGGGPAGSTTAALLARAGRRVIVFVDAWYTKECIEVFLAPRNALGLAPAIKMQCLAGMSATASRFNGGCGYFYFLVWRQRHHPIAPRLTLVPKKIEGSTAALTAGVMS